MIRARFRGRSAQLLAIYDCIKTAPPPGVHPGQIAKAVHMEMPDVVETLDRTPELFIRIPKMRDGLTRYRLTPQINVKEPDEVIAFINRLATRETWILYAVGLMGLCAFLIAIALFGPALQTVTE